MSARAKNDQALVTVGSKNSLQQNQAQGGEREESKERNKTIKETIGEKARV